MAVDYSRITAGIQPRVRAIQPRYRCDSGSAAYSSDYLYSPVGLLLQLPNGPAPWPRSAGKVTAYTLEQLLQEPAQLSSEKDRIGREIEELACRNYRAFLDNAEVRGRCPLAQLFWAA